jgi:hypothetical protein
MRLYYRNTDHQLGNQNRLFQIFLTVQQLETDYISVTHPSPQSHVIAANHPIRYN